jgi:hypothetical protein
MATPNPLPTLSNIVKYIHWALEETSGALLDSSGNGYNLTTVDWVSPRLASITGVVNKAIQTDSTNALGTWQNAVGEAFAAVAAPTKWMIEYYVKAPQLDSADKEIGLSILFSSESISGLNQVHSDSYITAGVSKLLIRRGTWQYEFTNDYAWHKVNIISYDGIYEHLYIDNALVMENQSPPSAISSYFIGGLGCSIIIDNTYLSGYYGKKLALDEIKLVTFEITPPVPARRINVGHRNSGVNLNPGATKETGVGNIGE